MLQQPLYVVPLRDVNRTNGQLSGHAAAAQHAAIVTAPYN